MGKSSEKKNEVPNVVVIAAEGVKKKGKMEIFLTNVPLLLFFVFSNLFGMIFLSYFNFI